MADNEIVPAGATEIIDARLDAKTTAEMLDDYFKLILARSMNRYGARDEKIRRIPTEVLEIMVKYVETTGGSARQNRLGSEQRNAIRSVPNVSRKYDAEARSRRPVFEGGEADPVVAKVGG